MKCLTEWQGKESGVFGVSPAFFISAYTKRFSPADIVNGLERIKALGFDAYQPEIYHEDSLGQWDAAAVASIISRQNHLGLKPTQFVAHFMIERFSNPENILDTESGVESFKACLDIALSFENIPCVTIPVPEIRLGSSDDLKGLWPAFTDKIGRLLALMPAGGPRLALEIMPRAVLCGTEGFLRLYSELGDRRLAYNFDAGHAWACKERLELVPWRLGSLIAGTHLGDNFGNENLKLAPGKGSIDFVPVLGALAASGYTGSLDVEIACGPADVDSEYAAGLDWLRKTTGAGKK
jgi:sugar phosphate isomerase/epimerase